MPHCVMLEGICSVCGSPLHIPIVRCPACDTPHHQDCWDYNRGCSIYGCSQVADAQVCVIDQEPPAIALTPEIAGRARQRLERVIRGTAIGLLATWGVLGWTRAWHLLIPAGIVLTLWELWQRGLDQDDAFEPAGDPRVALDLERKAVEALVGRGAVDQLAQMYALFEQRHPRLSLAPRHQRDVAKELLGRGYVALGLEALDKALRLPGEWDDMELRELRAATLIAEPAMAVEAVTGPLGPSQVGETGLETVSHALGSLLAPAPGEGLVYLLSLSPRGFTADLQSELLLPGNARPLHIVQGALMVGPLTRVEAASRLQIALAQGQPGIDIPVGELNLPRDHQDVIGLHLSQKEARFTTHTEEMVVEWRDLRAAILARIETIEIKREVTLEPTEGRSMRVRTWTKMHEEIDSRPVLEIHAGQGPIRLRITDPKPDLFRYLGRRKESALAVNLALVAKDLARFGPAMRFSHGIHHLLSARTGAGSHFSSENRFEEYVAWFHCLGSAGLRPRWKKVIDELELDRLLSDFDAVRRAGSDSPAEPADPSDQGH